MFYFEKLKEAWPSPVVGRSQLAVFSGGLINPKTMRNLDALKKGIPGKMRLNRKVFYPVENVIQWMIDHISEGKEGDIHDGE